MKYTGQFNEKNFLHRPAVLSLSMNQAFFLQCPNIFAHDCRCGAMIAFACPRRQKFLIRPCPSLRVMFEFSHHFCGAAEPKSEPISRTRPTNTNQTESANRKYPELTQPLKRVIRAIRLSGKRP